MEAFELQDTSICAPPDHRRVKDECLIAHKVYDSCRRQNCLTHRELGPARAAEPVKIDDHDYDVGDIIIAPHNAVSVTMDKVKIAQIQIMDKQPSPFRNGYWDMDVKYVFTYRLTFRETGSKVIGEPIAATSIFTMKATLFGSVGADLVIGTDMNPKPDGETMEAAPFIWVEAKALGLGARIAHKTGTNEIHVVLGLFNVLKLFRIVHLNVQSKGFCIPKECQDQGNINPCEYFADLDFPMDIFAPPQLPEFRAGVSENISKGKPTLTSLEYANE